MVKGLKKPWSHYLKKWEVSFYSPMWIIFLLKSSALFSLCLTRPSDWKVKLNGIKLKSTSGKCWEWVIVVMQEGGQCWIIQLLMFSAGVQRSFYWPNASFLIPQMDNWALCEVCEYRGVTVIHTREFFSRIGQRQPRGCRSQNGHGIGWPAVWCGSCITRDAEHSEMAE